MTTFADARGLAITAASAEAVRHYDGVMDAYLHFAKDTGAHLKQALGADPDFALAHCTKGYFFQLFCNRALEAKARQSLETARALAKTSALTPREELHLHALACWVAGDLGGAAACWDGILFAHPRDILALKLATYTHFYLGDSAQIRDSVARVRYAWAEDVPGYPAVLGMHAFGLEETGDYTAAEREGRRAVQMDPEDLWAVHAVAHVLEMQDRRREGAAWLEGSADHWGRGNNFVYHLWWHLALFYLELEDFDRVLALYDQRVRVDTASDEYLDICNAASLLWRLEERGIHVGGRWTELGEKSAARVGDQLMVFPDAHFVLSLAGAGKTEALAEMLRSMRDCAGRPGVTESLIAAEVGVSLCEALAAWYESLYALVVDRLMPVRYQIPRIGGSHAQRDMFWQMLIAACLRCDRLKEARALLCERTALKPKNVWSWRRYADALEAAGEAEPAAQARRKADALLAA
ncbi:MAG TPA: tetratricopeptide repeat protein [Gammaproteobacteria bacterium]|nr:tetratricopeptide repeat protein [Gammaproteobacteria bacterium]